MAEIMLDQLSMSATVEKTACGGASIRVSTLMRISSRLHDARSLGRFARAH
jgi:hypothetical protein